MCGIVAYAGPKSVHSVLLVGLTRLEYRGYDSAGIATIDKGELEVRKEKGKIKELEDLLKLYPIDGPAGIGHTRWATHGQPSKGNAHPHTDCKKKMALVHNGIIENHHILRNELISKGHLFHTDTDTEVIPHLIEEELKQTGDLKEAIRKAVVRLEGRYSFCLVHDDYPDQVFFARDGSPLVFGQGSGETFLASDILAVIPQAKYQYIIENGQWGYIDKDGMHLFDADGSQVEFETTKITMQVSELDKGGYEHFMLKEIYEQPDMLRRIIERRMDEKGKIRFDEMEMSNDFFGRVGRILVTSAGTSWHAGMVGKIYLERFARVATEVDISSEFRYRNPIAEGDTLVMAISQSGETADTLAGVHEAKAKFCRVLSLVNRTESTIAHESMLI